MIIYHLYINLLPGLSLDGDTLIGTFTTMGGAQTVINYVERKFNCKVHSIELNAPQDNSVLYSFAIKVDIKGNHVTWVGYVKDYLIDEW